MLEHPQRLIAIAVFLLLFGCAMPFMMVIKVVESTFLLNFMSFVASVLGLFLGSIGVAMTYVRKKNREEDRYK
jgi:hypothetical protein